MGADPQRQMQGCVPLNRPPITLTVSSSSGAAAEGCRAPPCWGAAAEAGCGAAALPAAGPAVITALTARALAPTAQAATAGLNLSVIRPACLIRPGGQRGTGGGQGRHCKGAQRVTRGTRVIVLKPGADRHPARHLLLCPQAHFRCQAYTAAAAAVAVAAGVTCPTQLLLLLLSAGPVVEVDADLA
jgi:hypothetical protein